MTYTSWLWSDSHNGRREEYGLLGYPTGCVSPDSNRLSSDSCLSPVRLSNGESIRPVQPDRILAFPTVAAKAQHHKASSRWA